MRSLILILLAGGLMGCSMFSGAPDKSAEDNVLFRADFSDGKMDGWWVEGGEKVWVQDGRLHVQANPAEMSRPAGVCTVWYNQKFQGDVEIEFDASVVESAIDANNINFFFHYTYPEEGKSIWTTRDERTDGDYPHYHNLNGYIVTFLNDFQRAAPPNEDGTLKARMRMRRCPGFNLINETFAHHCQAGQVYHCKIIKKGGHIEFYVDGKKFLEADDEHPLSEGYIGLRTFRTHLWWDNIVVRSI